MANNWTGFLNVEYKVEARYPAGFKIGDSVYSVIVFPLTCYSHGCIDNTTDLDLRAADRLALIPHLRYLCDPERHLLRRISQSFRLVIRAH